jgi:pilus assembly protein CpaE
MLDTLSLKNARLGLETLDLMGYDRQHTVLVLNRADSRVGISDEDVQRIVSRKPDVRVPSDVEVTRSVNDGRPIVISRPKAEASQSFRRLGDVFLSRVGPQPAMPAETAATDGDGKRARRHLLARRS